MATASLTGRLATIRLSTASTATTSQTAIAELKDYTLTVNRAEIDVTSHDSSGFKEVLSGIADWAWTADVLYLSTQASQADARDALLNSQLVNITFKQTTANASKKFQGKMRMTQFTVGHPTNDAVVGTMAGVGHGTLTRTA